MGTSQIHGRLDARRHRRWQRNTLAAGALKLHQDGGKALRQIVVNVAGQAVALFEDSLSPHL